MGLRLIQFLAITLTALALVPAGAHLAALPGKIGMTAEQYFTVQGIYRGWALFGVVLFGVLLIDIVLAAAQRRWRGPFWLAVLAFLLMAASLAVFFTCTFPANQATANWTSIPENWPALRYQWEFGHAGSALLTFLSLCAVVLSVLLPRDRPVDEDRQPRVGRDRERDRDQARL
jgi:hypothetical protein